MTRRIRAPSFIAAHVVASAHNRTEHEVGSEVVATSEVGRKNGALTHVRSQLLSWSQVGIGAYSHREFVLGGSKPDLVETKVREASDGFRQEALDTG